MYRGRLPGRGLFKPGLPRPPIFRAVFPDGLVDVFFKRHLVPDAVGNAPQLFVQKLPEHDAFLTIFLKAEIAALLETALPGGGRKHSRNFFGNHCPAVACGADEKDAGAKHIAGLNLSPWGIFRIIEHLNLLSGTSGQLGPKLMRSKNAFRETSRLKEGEAQKHRVPHG